MISNSVIKKSSQSLLIVGPLASLAVSPSTNYDPINLIKLLFISSIAFFNLGLFLTNLSWFTRSVSKEIRILSTLFTLFLCSTLIFSGAPLSQQIWGSFGRNTGFLTYVSLLLILIATSVILDIKFYKSLVNILILTSIPMTVYCLIQVANLDPIGWSEKHPFGTLGNINFSSAFFGLSSISALSLFLDSTISRLKRIGLIFLVIVDQLIILSTGSIQGFMIFVAGSGIALFILILKNKKLKILRLPYLIITFISTFLVIDGLSNRGPLSRFLFAPSIVFRTDYWHAGWAMTLSHPFFGVGLDSYGDWYRKARGEISTLRTGPDRISNTAHNIFLDISSNGGFPLIICYILLNLIALYSAIKILKRNSNFSPYFVAIFSTWCGYVIQALISINQVGVGIWGWIFTGAIIGYERISNEIGNSNTTFKQKKREKRFSSTLTPLSGVGAFFGFAAGFFLAFIPFFADMKYKSAISSRYMDKIISSTRLPGSSAFHSELALDTAIKNNLTQQAREISDYLISEYPRDFMGWKARWVLNTSTTQEKEEAKLKLRELDPYNPEFK